jgi:hypothetical protein
LVHRGDDRGGEDRPRPAQALDVPVAQRAGENVDGAHRTSGLAVRGHAQGRRRPCGSSALGRLADAGRAAPRDEHDRGEDANRRTRTETVERAMVEKVAGPDEISMSSWGSHAEGLQCRA